MRNLDHPDLAQYLIESEWAKKQTGSYNNRWNAVMVIPHKGTELRVIASRGEGWDHVSISLADRCPTWDEMEYVAKLLFKPSEAAMQLHLPEQDHINFHPFTLHWWRSWSKKIPLPPKRMV